MEAAQATMSIGLLGFPVIRIILMPYVFVQILQFISKNYICNQFYILDNYVFSLRWWGLVLALNNLGLASFLHTVFLNLNQIWKDSQMQDNYSNCFRIHLKIEFWFNSSRVKLD